VPIILWGFVPFVPIVGLALDHVFRGSIWTAGLDRGVPLLVAKAAREAVATEIDPKKRFAFAVVLESARYPRTALYVAHGSGAASGSHVSGFLVGGVGVDYASFATDPSVPQDLKSRLSASITPAGTEGIQNLGMSGIQAVAGGGSLSPSEIQGGFALASAGALALGAGMSLSAAMPIMLPIAAVVFGGGVEISSLLRSVLKISDANTSQIYACTPGDTSNGSSPSDPKWKRAYTPSLYDEYSVGSPNWHPATSGKFETWARPILMRAEDGYLNCQPPPGVQQVSADDLQKAVSAGDLSGVGKLTDYYEALWQLGAIKAWNDLNVGAPMRSIALDTTIPYGDPRGNDVVQKMLWRFRRTLKLYASEYASGAPIAIQVADPAPKPKSRINLFGAIRGSVQTPSTPYTVWNLAQWVAHYVPGVPVAVSD
jgi:hypothetical protein